MLHTMSKLEGHVLARNTDGQDLAVLSIQGTGREKIVAAGSYTKRAFFPTPPHQVGDAKCAIELQCGAKKDRRSNCNKKDR
jgi:hypothetical protein